jgi:hypothetical protein
MLSKNKSKNIKNKSSVCYIYYMKIVNGVLTFNSHEEFAEKAYNISSIKNYVFDKIKTAFELDIEHVYLFKIKSESSYFIVKVKKCEWLSALEKCQEFFLKNEDYKRCEECFKLMCSLKEKAS